MTLGAIALIILILFFFLKTHSVKQIFINLLSLTIIIELMIERGYFIILGSQQIPYRTVCEVILFFLALIWFVLGDKKIDMKLLRTSLLCSIVLLAGILGLLILPTQATGATFQVDRDTIITTSAIRQPIIYNSWIFAELIHISIYLVVALAAYKNLNKQDWLETFDKVVRYSKYILFFCSFEVISKYFFNSSIFFDIIDFILGVSISTSSDLTIRGSGYSLCGLTKEASHYAFILSVLFILYLADCFKCRQDYNVSAKDIYKKMIANIYIVLLWLIMMSFSVLYYCACIILIFILLWAERNNRNSLRIFFVIFAGIALLLIGSTTSDVFISILNTSGFWGRRILSLQEEIDLLLNGDWLSASSALEWSNRARLGSTVETLKLFFYRPIIGLGFASVTAHSSLAMLISGGGILGTYGVLNINFWVRKIQFCNYSKTLFVQCSIVYLLMRLFNSLGLRPFYEFWNILIVVALQYLCSYSSQRKSNKTILNTSV